MEDENPQSVYIKQVSAPFFHDKDTPREIARVLVEEVKDDKILGNKTLELFITTIWDSTYTEILKWVFIPYCIQFTLFIIYVSFVYTPDPNVGSIWI